MGGGETSLEVREGLSREWERLESEACGEWRFGVVCIHDKKRRLMPSQLILLTAVSKENRDKSINLMELTFGLWNTLPDSAPVENIVMCWKFHNNNSNMHQYQGLCRVISLRALSRLIRLLVASENDAFQELPKKNRDVKILSVCCT